MSTRAATRNDAAFEYLSGSCPQSARSKGRRERRTSETLSSAARAHPIGVVSLRTQSAFRESLVLRSLALTIFCSSPITPLRSPGLRPAGTSCHRVNTGATNPILLRKSCRFGMFTVCAIEFSAQQMSWNKQIGNVAEIFHPGVKAQARPPRICRSLPGHMVGQRPMQEPVRVAQMHCGEPCSHSGARSQEPDKDVLEGSGALLGEGRTVRSATDKLNNINY